MLPVDSHRGSLLFVGVSVSLVCVLSLTAQYSFLLFHSLAELFCIVVAASIFLVGWNTDRFVGVTIFRPLGIGFLHVALVTALHTLAYSGMGVFVGTTTNLATQLWILARFLETATLVAAPFIMRAAWSRIWVFGVYSAVTGAALLMIAAGQFPVCWAEGALTPFKIASEYVIIAFLSVSAVYYWKREQSLTRGVVGLLVLAIAFAIVAELSFTLYTDPVGPFNMFGHYLTLVSFYLIYRAFISETLVRPYENLFGGLAKANEMLRLTNKTIRHDIRNEAHKIELALELVKVGAEPASLADAQRGMKRLEDMLENISAIDDLDKKGRVPEIVHLYDLVQRAADGSAVQVRIAGSCSALGGQPLVSAVRNIIRNAEEHSESESVDISIHPDGELCVIRIADTGRGIPAEIRSRLFEEGVAFGESAGTGLGLYIAKKIVTAYGGLIDVKDNEPHGAVFEIRLRRADSLGSRRIPQEA